MMLTISVWGSKKITQRVDSRLELVPKALRVKHHNNSKQGAAQVRLIDELLFDHNPTKRPATRTTHHPPQPPTRPTPLPLGRFPPPPPLVVVFSTAKTPGELVRSGWLAGQAVIQLSRAGEKEKNLIEHARTC